MIGEFEELKSGLTSELNKGIRLPLSLPKAILRAKFDYISWLNSKLANLQSAFNESVTLELQSGLEGVMGMGLWEYNDETRDIVNTGELRDSLEISMDGSSNINISYNTDYANLIYYGGYILPYGNTYADKVYIPPRPWVEAMLNGDVPGFDYREVISRAISNAQ